MSHWPDTPALLERLATMHHIGYQAGLPPAPRRLRTPEGLALNCLDWAGTGEPILFLHGGALTAHTWDLVCLAMRDGFHCVAIDLRGHGDSAWADSYTIDDYVHDVAAVVAAFGWASAHIVGMSLGGIIAAHYAATAGSRAASLVLIDVAPNVDFDAIGPMRQFLARPIADLTLDQLVEAAVHASTRGGREKIFYRFLHMTRERPDGKLAWRQDRTRPRDYGHLLGRLDELTELASAIACRVLILRGGQSGVLTEEKVQAFAARCRQAQWLTIPGAGHNVQEDQPLTLATTLRNFFSHQSP